MNEKQEYEKQADESFEDYLKRISKIDKLPEEILKRLLFRPGESFSPIKLNRWISGCFKGEFKIGSLGYLHPTKDFIEWINREDILEKWESLGEKRASTADQFIQLVLDNSQGENQKPKKGFLPAPEGTEWNDVSIAIKEDTQIEIIIKGKSRNYNLEKFKKEIIPQLKSWEYFFRIIQSGGIFNMEDIDPDENKPIFKSNLSRLRALLKETFGITSDPIPWVKSSYHVQFSVSTELGV